MEVDWLSTASLRHSVIACSSWFGLSSVVISERPEEVSPRSVKLNCFNHSAIFSFIHSRISHGRVGPDMVHEIFTIFHPRHDPRDHRPWDFQWIFSFHDFYQIFTHFFFRRSFVNKRIIDVTKRAKIQIRLLLCSAQHCRGWAAVPDAMTRSRIGYTKPFKQ